jgi:hypothetical protein
MPLVLYPAEEIFPYLAVSGAVLKSPLRTIEVRKNYQEISRITFKKLQMPSSSTLLMTGVSTMFLERFR